MLFKRDIYENIKKYFNDDEILVIHGARQVGKTSLMNFILLNNADIESRSFYINLEDPAYLKLCNSGVSELIDFLQSKGKLQSGKLFLFIDEIQYLENPSNFLKLLFDRYRSKIKLIVSGSSSFSIKSKFKDSLVGRTIDFELFPLSFNEFLLFKKIDIDISHKITLQIIIEELKKLFKTFIKTGGFPAIVLEDNFEKKEKKLNQIISTYIKADIRDLAGIRNLNKFNNFIEMLSSQVGSLLNISELSNSIGLSKQTIDDYLFILENTYIIKIVRPYYKNLRSELTKMPKIFFEDNGIANLLRVKTLDVEITGQIFENAVFNEIRKITDASNIRFWRTAKGHEIDFIVNLHQSLIPVETKLKVSKKRQTSLFYFKNKYNIEKNYLCSLEPLDGIQNDWLQFIYPWEIKLILSK